MSETYDMPLPQRLLLANDLSHRCDRALDRAVLLARQWHVPLLSLTALEPGELLSLAGDGSAEDGQEGGWREGADARIVAERRIRADIDDDDLVLEVRVEEGAPAEVILATSTPDDLIITGIASSRTLGSILLGNTTDRVARRARVPVLVVRQRARRPYRRMVVATDFSESSRRALHMALAMFPDAGITLFHAYYPPFAGRLDSEQARAELLRAARDEAQAFLDDAGIGAGDRRRTGLRLAFGSVEALLGDYVREVGTDLIVLGSHGRTAAFDTLIGSTARRVLESADTDVLVVRDPRART